MQGKIETFIDPYLSVEEEKPRPKESVLGYNIEDRHVPGVEWNNAAAAAAVHAEDYHAGVDPVASAVQTANFGNVEDQAENDLSGARLLAVECLGHNFPNSLKSDHYFVEWVDAFDTLGSDVE